MINAKLFVCFHYLFQTVFNFKPTFVKLGFIHLMAANMCMWGLAFLRTQFGVSGLLGAELYQGHHLIKNGPYALIRHPMYAGVLLAAIGALLIFRTWAMLIFMPMSLVVVGRAEREEKLLKAEFGEQWESYASKVPKWFPRL